MFSRTMQSSLEPYKKFPAIAILGPRQAGKTTLAKLLFPKHKFLTLDHEATRSFAMEDPERFLASHDNEHGIILDEFQYAPALTGYIKQHVDKQQKKGYFILTGSQNFLANSTISESLAGRVGIVNLFPLSLYELQKSNLIANQSLDTVLLNGCYPRLHKEQMSAPHFYPSYLQSYVERDVRQLINIGNLSTFQRFLQLCAGRIGSLVNFEALAVETGVSATTVKTWLAILEASYVIFLLQPHHKNFNKRMVKSPKLYFFDTGLACSLLRLTDEHSLSVSTFRGALFESLIISDLYKQYCNKGQRPPLYFWRDQGGAHEIDCIVDEGIKLFPIEIKSGQTINQSFFKGLSYWNKLTDNKGDDSFIVYGGSENQPRNKGNIVGWRESSQLIDVLQQKKRT